MPPRAKTKAAKSRSKTNRTNQAKTKKAMAKPPGARKSAGQPRGQRPSPNPPAAASRVAPEAAAAGADHAAPVLSRHDVHRIVADLSRELAPADIEAIVNDEERTRQRLAELPGDYTLLREQMSLALDCLRDHVDGECPQIPYYTIAVLGAAVTYFSDEIDVVPDFLPGGTLDDAIVMAMACEMGFDGLQRYCTATGRDPHGVLFAPGHR